MNLGFTKKWWFGLLVVGVLLRLILMPITFHPDLWGHSSTAYFFAYEGRLDIYDYLASLPSSHPLAASMGVGDIFIYPPLTYFTLGLFRVLVKPFANPNFMPMIWQNSPAALAFPTLHWHLFLFKLPYLFIDVAAAFLFAELFADKKKKLAFGLWIFNPLTLYATFMVGQIDLLPTFFTIASLYFAKKKQFRWSMMSLGFGAAYKTYPLLLVLPAAFLFADDFKGGVKNIAWGVLPYILTIVPYLGSPAFRQMVLFSSKSTKMLFMRLNVSGAEVVYPFLVLLVVIYLHASYARQKLSLAGYYLVVLLLIISVTHYHPQWFLWLTPFLYWFLVSYGRKYTVLVVGMFTTWFVITLLFEASLSYGLFSPVWPGLVHAPSLTAWVDNFTDSFQIKSVMRSLFAGAAVYTSLILFREDPSKVA